jgi:hypothetical protein
MSTSSNEFRKLMNLCESVDALDEGPMLNRLMSRFGNQKASGRVQRDELAKKMKDQFSVWIGRTGREGSMQDVEQFLTTLGYPGPAVQQIVGKSNPSFKMEPTAPGILRRTNSSRACGT